MEKTELNPHGLNARVWRFAQEYVVDENGTQAAIRSGFSRQSARLKAAELLTDERVQETIKVFRLRKLNPPRIDRAWFSAELKLASERRDKARSDREKR